MQYTDTRPVDATSPQVTFAGLAGMTYLLAGLLGWLVTDRFVGSGPANLLGFHVNGLHNFVHLALGAAWIAAAVGERFARRVNLVLGSLLLVVAVAGLVGLLKGLLNVRAGLDADNLLHLGTGALAVWLARNQP